MEKKHLQKLEHFWTDRNTQIIAVVAFIAICLAVLLLSGPKVTGRFFAPSEEFSVTGDTFAANSTYLLNITQEQPYNLKSLKLSGSFAGQHAKVYLKTANATYLVLNSDNLAAAAPVADLISGAFTEVADIVTGSSEPQSESKADEKASQEAAKEEKSAEKAAEKEAQKESTSEQQASTPVQEAPSEAAPAEETPEEIPPATEQPVEVPAEQPQETPPEEIPPEEQPVEQPVETPANETLPPSENVTVPEIVNETLPANETIPAANETLPPSENLTLENTTFENLTIENITIENAINFTDICEETCMLPDGLDASSYELVIEIENSSLLLSEIRYSLLNLSAIPITINITIVDSSGEPVSANISLLDNAGEPVHQETGLLENILPPAEQPAANTETFEVNPSTQNDLAVDIATADVPIKSIEFQNLEATEDINAVIGVDNVPEDTANLTGAVEVYAIDPTQLNFTEATVTVTATGSSLYKCADWDFANQTCVDGNWVFLQSITPGQPYEFTLTSEDPGFAEIKITAAQHLDANRTFISDIYDEVKAVDDIWSEPIYYNQYVRATFEREMTNGNVINFYVRNNESTNTSIDVYEKNGSVLLVSTPIITETKQYDVELSGMSGNATVFDFKIVNQDGNSLAYLEFDYIKDDPGNATGTPGAEMSFFMDSEAHMATDKNQESGDNFDECPIQLNDYGTDVTEKCSAWDCTAWSAATADTAARTCTKGWNCSAWNGVTCANFVCLGWSESATAVLPYCSGDWTCKSWNGNYCRLWNCSAWTNGASQVDTYCSGTWNCTQWNGANCNNWDCTAWSNGAVKKDTYCSGLWDCMSWNGSNCNKWNCTAWTAPATAALDAYCNGSWKCAAWSGTHCADWNCTNTILGASTYDEYCDNWNCTTWNDTSKACGMWDCLQWVQGATTKRDYYCSGSFNCTSWKTISYVSVAWSTSSLVMTGDVNATNVTGTANITSTSANNNVTVTCASGNCTKITNNWANGTNMTDGQIRNVTFACNASVAGAYNALFNLVSNEDTTPDVINVSCNIIAPSVSWSQSTLSLSGEIDSTITGTANITSTRINHNVIVNCTSGACSTIANNWTDGTNMTDGQNTVVTFTCNSETVGSYSALFGVVSTEDTSPNTINASCTVSQKSPVVYSAHPDPIDKDQPGKFAVIVANPKSTNVNVTAVYINASTAVNTVFNAVVQGAGSSYPTSGWTLTGNKIASWTGSETVDANSAKAFWVNIDPKAVTETFTVSYSAIVDSVTYQDPDSHASQELNGNLQFTTLAFENSTTYPIYVETATGSVKKTYQISMEENAGKIAIPSGVTLTIVLPSTFTNIESNDGTGWGNASVVGNTITVNTTTTVISSRITYSFNATATLTGLHVMNASMSGTGARAILDGIVKVTDNTPPATVTNLTNKSAGLTWIYWTWTNPSDLDFDKAIIYIDGSNILNTSNAYYNATGFSCGTWHNITINTKDKNKNVNTTNVTNSAKTAACPGIIVTQNSPANNAIDGDGSVLFNCSASTGLTNLANISLYLNTVLNQTNAVSGISNTTTFSKTLANGNYNWYCNAKDTLGNSNNSATYGLKVDTTAVPTSTKFTGNTTNWAALPDLTNVCNGQAILEVPSYGAIQWYGCVNASYQNFNVNVNISNNLVTVNFGLNPTFNSSAHITMRNLTWAVQPEILMNGMFCNESVCQNITYDNVSILNFDVAHFTNFTTVGNSQLAIWDQNDTGMPGGNLSACLGSQIKFFANYTKSKDGKPITGATCILNFTDSTGNSMGYNTTSILYEYNRTFASIGNKTYIVTCSETKSDTITLSDSIIITDCAPPQWSNNQSSYPTTYNASWPPVFNITWTDGVNVSAVLIEGNWSGSTKNYSMNLISGTTANGVWNYSTVPLAAGTYHWKSYANDTSNLWNATTQFTFTINKAGNPADLYLNGNKNQNVTIIYGTQSNATGFAFVGTANLTRDGLQVNNPEVTTLAAKPAGYNYTVATAGNANYSANSTTYYLFVNKQSTSIDLYLNGAQSNLTVTYSTQTNVTAIGYNGTVILYRNGVNVTNPDIATLGVSTYNYTAVILDDANRTGSTKTFFLTITKQPTAVDLFLNGFQSNLNITYGTQSNATAVGYNGTVVLYRNGVNVTNPEIATLGVNIYNYTAVIPDDANRTGSTKTYFLNVTRAASQVQLLLDGSPANKTVEVGSTVNLTATLITPGTGVVQLYRNGTIINSGNAPITNLSAFSTLGTFNITETYPATQNYSTSSQTFYVTTQDTTPPNVYLTSPGNNTAITTRSQGFTFNASDNYYGALSCTLYINDIASGTNASVVVSTPTTITNTSIPEGHDLWHVNCTDGSSNTGKSEVRALTVDTTPPVITHIRPVQNDIIGYNTTLEITATDNTSSVNSVWYQIRNISSSIVKSGVMSGAGPIYTDVWDTTTVSEGNYTFTVYANDTLGNQGNSTVNFRIDNTPPLIQIFTPLNGSKWNSNFNLNVSIQNSLLAATSYNITNSTGAVVQSNSNNTLNQTTFYWTDAVSVNSLPSGAYNLLVYARNSVGYPVTESVMFIIDKLAPQYSDLSATPATPATYSPSQTYVFNATWTDNLAISAVILEFNGTNYTDFVQTGNVYSKTFSGLNASTYNYKWYANDTTGNWNSTSTLTYTINKASTTTNLYLNGTRANATITYGTQSNATAVTSIGSLVLYRNGVNVTNPEIATLGVNTYNYTAVNTGDANYLPSSETWFLIVSKTAPALNLLLDGAAADKNVTYPVQTNATAFESNTGDSDVSYTLYRNSNTIGSGSTVADVQTLGANTYIYNYNTTGGANYTSGAINRTLTVSKQSTAVDLYLDGAQSNLTVTYETQTNVTAVGYNGTVILYRNGVNVTNPEIATLGVNTYNYTAVILGDANRTGSTKTFFLTVVKQPTAVDLFLNGSQSDLNITYGTQSNITAVGYNATVTLYKNGLTISNPEIAVLAAGTYNYTAVTGDANHTASSKTFFLTVSKATPALNLLLDGTAADKNVTYPAQTNATGYETNTGDSDLTYTLYRNSVSVGSGSSVSDVQTLAVNTYYYIYNTTGGANYTANAVSRTLGVYKIATAVNLYLNGNQSNLTVTYGTQTNVTAVGYNGTVVLYKNGINITNPEVTILGVNTYNYTAVIPDDANRTGSTKTFFLTVNKAAANITLLLNGINNDLIVNRSQTVNITGIRTNGSGNMQLYDNGALINSGAPVITNITNYSTLGVRNITLTLPETQNFTAITSTHFLSVYGILSAYLTAPGGMPKYYEGQNITFRGYVRDELASPIDGATVTFEPINDSYTYLCGNTAGLGSGVYNCTLDTTGMTSPRVYAVRINATKTYYHAASYTNASVFLLESGQKANLLLHKIPSVQSITSSQITYNISLHLANGRGTSDNTTIADSDANQTWSIGSIYGAQEAIVNYLITYNRGSSDQLITLQKANATGYDPFYTTNVFTESNQPTVVVPQNITGAQLTLIKNIIYLSQTTTNITYQIVDELVNSGGQDLTNIAVVDSDISLTTAANLTRGASISYSGNKTIVKNSQSYTFTFTNTSAFANSQFFYSNQPSIQIPGYGGPYDVIIDSLPSSVSAGSTITGIVKAINMNSEISEDRTLTTWIADSVGTVLALDVRTIFVGRNQSATASVTLTAPATAGTYYFVSELTWPTATANASKAFDVTSVTPPAPAPSAGGAGPGVPVNITLPPGVPQDIIDSLIELRNMYNELNLKTGDLNNILKAAEDAAARGNYDLARNLIYSAYGEVAEIQKEICGKTNITMPKIGVAQPVTFDIARFFGAKWLTWLLLIVATTIFIIAVFVWRNEEEAFEISVLREEREHLERLYDKVGAYLNRKKNQGDKKNEV